MKRTRDEEEREDDAVASSAEGSGGTGAPKPRAPDVAARLALGALPCSEMYEKSFMHRDHVTHIVCTSSDFIVTGSRDGQVKFWKKMQMGIEFVKHFRAHLAPVSCMAATSDGSLLATTAADKAFKARITAVTCLLDAHSTPLSGIPACPHHGATGTSLPPLIGL